MGSTSMHSDSPIAGEQKECVSKKSRISMEVNCYWPGSIWQLVLKNQLRGALFPESVAFYFALQRIRVSEGVAVVVVGIRVDFVPRSGKVGHEQIHAVKSLFFEVFLSEHKAVSTRSCETWFSSRSNFIGESSLCDLALRRRNRLLFSGLGRSPGRATQ